MVEGISGVACSRTKGSVRFTIKSIFSKFELDIHALVIGSITSVTPAVSVDIGQWRHLANLQLADPHFGTPGHVDVLLGADVWGSIVEGDVIHGGYDEPHAQLTRLGWVVFGPASVPGHSSTTVGNYCAQIRDESYLEDLICNFWKLEEVPVTTKSSDDECERFFATTHQRMADGRYVVRLPFRQDGQPLGDSYVNARRQFSRLERRLAADPDMHAKYIAFMREYESLGHMERVVQPVVQSGCYYIPHHAVLGKFRVVFNASAPTSNGLSLNDIQLVGSPIQDSLINIILRFRRYAIAITADVEKMFRQVLVAAQDRDFQRILWRESPSEEVITYRLSTVTYGMACSPHNAIRAMHQCAYDSFDKIHDRNMGIQAREAILSSFYVDDFLTSCSTVDSAITLATNIDTILTAGGFKLRKWNSNDAAVLIPLGKGLSPTECPIDAPVASVLGLRWSPVDDILLFNVELKQPGGVYTKRSVLSEVAKLFDPTGFLSPVVVVGKIFIQTLWSAGIDWDTALTTELREIWLTFRNDLTALNMLRIPRWLGMKEGSTTTLYGFCDASQKAYAAVVYARTTNSQGDVHVALITARTKVAPLRGATIPRLELCAAQLLAETLRNVRSALGLVDQVASLWSDSTITLCWLRKQPETLKPYVSNRVRRIQELTLRDEWHYVRSSQNPADCASRGISASELLDHHLWWSGPSWLRDDTIDPTCHPKLRDCDEAVVNSERRVQCLAVTVTNLTLTTRRLDGEIIPLTDRFSSLKKLIHTTALILRWLPRSRSFRRSTIDPQEMETALEWLMRIDQMNAFPKDIRCIQGGSALPTASSILPLNPYLDDHGLLRVGGRISKSALIEAHRHPIILPKSTGLVRLLITQAHIDTLHGGTQLTLQTLRCRFWIIHGRVAVRSLILKCVICRRNRGAVLTQQMASLPRHRVQAARPFIASGVDYCGPFNLRIGTKRSRTTVKTYLAIFVCTATKAVHIEVADDLSTQAFLDVFTRFVSRRGPCRDLYSDNGTAFVGANRVLKEDLAAWFKERSIQSLADLGTRWHFITPSAPHQGGLWEAAVKSAKRHLVRVVGTQALWYSQLQTLATRIEACLNSRPLVPLHDDPDDKYALTPADFLIGSQIIAIPEPDVSEIPANRVKHWQWLRQMHQLFWKRWNEEYLATLQARTKWQRRVPNIRLGDIVVIRHENLPPTHWRLARVTELHPGTDGAVRNVTLATAHGSCTRAVQKLCLLLEDHIETNVSTGEDV
ncbi:uncharacterized protein LOC128861894 [Anastrepha ludens]|uniref:uncharacterized protein LOC128861894 n=1 Tax=Anastrepha ludens TaxID=28586 RepID=UPI0023B12DAA|nr:uncharacterized protein LOC128861894 [Anastrepha ludens]